MSNKSTGIYLLIASLIVATAILIRGGDAAAQPQTASPPASQIGRYQFHPSTPPGVIWIIDTTTGEITSKKG